MSKTIIYVDFVISTNSPCPIMNYDSPFKGRRATVQVFRIVAFVSSPVFDKHLPLRKSREESKF